MLTHRLTTTWTNTTRNSSSTIEKTGDTALEIRLSVPDGADGTTGNDLSQDITVANMQMLYMLSTQDITVYTNDQKTGAPQDTISLKANEPLTWYAGQSGNPFSGDVTKLYFENASGQAATFQLECLLDASPL